MQPATKTASRSITILLLLLLSFGDQLIDAALLVLHIGLTCFRKERFSQPESSTHNMPEAATVHEPSRQPTSVTSPKRPETPGPRAHFAASSPGMLSYKSVSMC